MTPEEAAKMLAFAATLDPRLRPPSEADALARSQTWAMTMDSDMPVGPAIRIITDHYRESTTCIMPADINKAWRIQRREDKQQQAAIERAQQQAREEAAAVPMPEEFRVRIAALAASKALE